MNKNGIRTLDYNRRMFKKNLDIIASLMDILWKAIDLPLRMRNAIKRQLLGANLFSKEQNLSDSQVTFYEAAVKKIVSNENQLMKFRRVYDYREILEHVDFKTGKAYLAHAIAVNPKLLATIESFKKNDSMGRPRMFNYDDIGKISPTTLRYIAVAADLQKHFGAQAFERIAEVGGGYGGQASILSTLGYFKSYYIFDLPQVRDLIEKYLRQLEVSGVTFPDLNANFDQSYDLFISNYAFSELPRELQMKYLDKLILKSKRGYMLMNSGLTNSTGRSSGKISLSELREHIPNLVVSEEIPHTSPDNYLVTWKP
jgi:putative sugar O-methyltransferase